MLERLGHVLGWTGNIIGGLMVVVGIYLLLNDPPLDWFKLVIALGPGVAVFLLGRAFRYILAGRSDNGKIV